MNDNARSGGNETLKLALNCSRIRAVTGSSNIGKRIQETRRRLFFFSIRWLERRLPVRLLYWILRPHAFVRAAVKGIPAPVSVPSCRGAAKSGRAAREWRMKGYLNRMLEYLPDRLAEPEWMELCHVAGLEPVLQARQNRRSVVLAFPHFGAYRLAKSWLRSAGLPVATMHGGKAESRSKLERLEDAFSPLPGIPTVFYSDQLREVNEFLAAGNLLLIAIDHENGRQMTVPVCDGWTFQMATGAVRLAVRHRAELIPCVVIDGGRWHFQIKLGRPGPPECLADGIGWTHAGKHLLDEMLPHFRSHPRHCSHQFIKRFRPPLDAPGDATGGKNPR